MMDRDLTRLIYDPEQLKYHAGHIGVGAFHRGHQQSYYDDLARRGERAWGVVGMSLMPPDLVDIHTQQRGEYSLLVEDHHGRALRRIGTLRHLLSQPDPRDPIWDGISFATLTITEKGYCHRPGTTEPDTSSALAHDLADPQDPRTGIGFLALMLDRRRREGGNGITLASCDNIPANGDLLQSVLSAYVSEALPELYPWMLDNVAFPNSMVDRIVPAMDPIARARLADAWGAPDDLGVVAEPFRQWVIEDRFAAARPPLEMAGVQIVANVAAHEHMKHRLLNGLQSALAELGRLAGHDTSFAAASDPAIAAWAHRFMSYQARTLKCPPGEDLVAYADTSFDRLRNPLIRHPLNQIASDASFKIPQRIVLPAAELIARGETPEPHAAVLAAWAILAGDTTADSFGLVVSDPGADRVSELREEHAASSDFGRALLSEPMFPPALSGSDKFVRSVATWIAAFREASGPDAVRALLSGPGRESAHA